MHQLTENLSEETTVKLDSEETTEKSIIEDLKIEE